jgi:hypothetical protein
MVSFTKGEGYGRPLAEFATTGKPIIVSNWSGFKDFLPEEHTLYLDGELKNVDASAANKFLLKESKWFYVNYSKAAQILYKTFDNYTQSLKQSQGLKTNINKNFTLDKMTSKLGELLDKYVKVAKKVEMKLPTINKL